MTADRPSKPAAAGRRDDRDERLAQALRANLQRRKRQARAKDRAADPAPPVAAGDDPGDGRQGTA
ncbi:hypothetical protein EV659_104102 [Rhodothalassium salexigens DSM 2132]|uniref:Uncharacterized protein n=1 Tax=Rhodothalassium salexigens DSM 2132 TaxID=1188247 RepID=A0A4R2PIE5_RHOSA|nr:hypothetical protein [Rhodothalassium salexigens]MBB4211331.1 hypothetical protein [Rhodothalassium salexigens DSM 2132]MBK1639503.1 hypothetical protein [Rhodothalassium salexigens DSM 2132]TCP35252.1 hypothetical protein EV659_104102 [Rhodothalassium salexigens DSM 2132]